MKKVSPISLLLSFASLFGFWLIMSGYFDWFHMSLGVLSVLIVLIMNHSLKQHSFYADEKDDLRHLRYGYFLYYLLWLSWQIIASGFHVAGIILRKSLPISTYIVRFKADLPSAHARMILGNSITLTPGTLTIDIQGNEFTVHALTPQSISTVVDDNMPSRVARLFTKERKSVVYDVRFYSSPEELS
ncbi:MAG: Na+/H+ antiporter subunit E [Leptospiraceae bacterium]|nr:Na+/H+ antiporter subunit E [Leptospiraceae bacterium]MCB1302800.1 Na+/H+ antiporter subunit E [Leptospiraceae bacterium]